MIALVFNSFLSSVSENIFQNTIFNMGALFNVIQFILMASLGLWALRIVSKGQIGKSLTNDMLLLLSVGLFAPVAEEIVFRGIVFQSIAKIVYSGFNNGTHVSMQIIHVIILFSLCSKKYGASLSQVFVSYSYI